MWGGASRDEPKEHEPSLEHGPSLEEYSRQQQQQEERKEEEEQRREELREEEEQRRQGLKNFNENRAASLVALFTRHHLTHTLSANFFKFIHYWKLFLPIQIFVTIAATLAFLASSAEASDYKDTAFALTLTSGVLGFVVALLNAIDRYTDWRTRSELHKQAAGVYESTASTLFFETERLNDVEAQLKDEKQPDDSKLNLDKFRDKLTTLKESTGDLAVPYEIEHAFLYIEQVVDQQVKTIDVISRQYYHMALIGDGREAGDDSTAGQTVNRFERVESGLEMKKVKITISKSELYLAAYSALAAEITKTKSSYFWRRWPGSLAPPRDVATKALATYHENFLKPYVKRILTEKYILEPRLSQVYAAYEMNLFPVDEKKLEMTSLVHGVVLESSTFTV